MPNLPPVYHKLMALLDEPDLTETENVLIRVTANLLAQDAVQGTLDEDDLSNTIDPRLRFTRDVFYKMPDRFELIRGDDSREGLGHTQAPTIRERLAKIGRHRSESISRRL